ncbi:hypothetical protein ETD86_52840 [Nonomuraea turkmeniaca]|uniref:Uncharacterized protein n=1 Tax=Nonomuraea turkmeniaca TaxID=103838 RepID=A0A5S4EVB1_9ACTN|nr:hypothetical protein [Nonomuraea turkmeniaca]TMR06380.1 hypothetical protein ETD86_52840 [Nonomuraea turkmeniaca]
MLNPVLPLRAAFAELLHHLRNGESCGPGCVRSGPADDASEIRCRPFEAAAEALDQARSASSTAIALPVPSDTAAYGQPVNTVFGQLSIVAGRVQLATACGTCARVEVRTADPRTTMLNAAAFADAAQKAAEPDPAEVQRIIHHLRTQGDFDTDRSWPGFHAATTIITALLRSHTVAAKSAE